MDLIITGKNNNYTNDNDQCASRHSIDITNACNINGHKLNETFIWLWRYSFVDPAMAMYSSAWVSYALIDDILSITRGTAYQMDNNQHCSIKFCLTTIFTSITMFCCKFVNTKSRLLWRLDNWLGHPIITSTYSSQFQCNDNDRNTIITTCFMSHEFF